MEANTHVVLTKVVCYLCSVHGRTSQQYYCCFSHCGARKTSGSKIALTSLIVAGVGIKLQRRQKGGQDGNTSIINLPCNAPSQKI